MSFDFTKSSPHLQRAVNIMRAKIYDVNIMSHANRISSVVTSIVSLEEADAYVNELTEWRASRDSISQDAARQIEKDMVLKYCQKWQPNLEWMFE